MRTVVAMIVLLGLAGCSGKKTPPWTRSAAAADVLAGLGETCLTDEMSPGDELACFGATQSAMHGRAADVQQLLADAKTGCDAGASDACYWASILLGFPGGDSTRLAIKSCDGGYAPACVRLAELAAESAARLPAGDEHSALTHRAAELFSRACAGGLRSACDR